MHEVASTLLQYETAFQAASADVPSALRVGSRSQPLGRYLRRTLRKLVGMSVNAPTQELRKYADEVLPLLIASKKNPHGLKSEIVKRYSQKILSMKSKEQIRKQGRHL